jgi:hypothetical protein
MAPHIVGGLASGMAHDGHIHRENYEFTGVKGLVPVPAYSRGPNLRHVDLGSVARGGHTLGTTLGGSIPEFTLDVVGPNKSICNNSNALDVLMMLFLG